MLTIDSFRRLTERSVGIPFTDGNTVEVLRNGVEIFPAMLEAIEGAHHTVDLGTYVYWTGDVAPKFADALSRKAQNGVRVRVLLDAVGAFPMNRDLVEEMTGAGCIVEWFRRPQDGFDKLNNRTHRKILVVDSKVGFTGGVGIAAEWEGDARSPEEWRDSHFRVRGPAVDGLQAAFTENWVETGHPVIDDWDVPAEPDRPGLVPVQVVASESGDGWGPLVSMLESLILLARERLRITCAYFIPNERFTARLCEAAQRGVAVEILVPGTHHDKRVVGLAGRSTYEALLEAGCRIWHYERTMLHAKVATVDGIAACVGSSNFDERSLRQNEECNMLVLDGDVAATLDRHFDDDVSDAEEIDLSRFEDRSFASKVAERFAGLFKEQL